MVKGKKKDVQKHKYFIVTFYYSLLKEITN